MGFKDPLRKALPEFLLERIRLWKRKGRRRALEAQRRYGKTWNQESLTAAFRSMGMEQGSTWMVHSSLGAIGYVEGGAETVVKALLNAVGPEGHLLMPSSPIAGLQLDFARGKREVDLRTIPSAMGSISEVFRCQSGVLRSAHPTEPVLAIGPNAEWLTEGHLGQKTPYNAYSPYRRMMELNGYILYLGVTLDNAGTHLHTLEDALDFPYPIYAPELFPFQLTDVQGGVHQVKTRVHNPEWSKKRRCDELLPLFDGQGVLRRAQLGKAECLLLNAQAMFECMIKAFEERGVTMYHPLGNAH